MQTKILKLESVVIHGAGGAQAAAISLIYTVLLQRNRIDFYRYIFINQIGEDLNEFVMKEGKKVYINIRYTAYEDYELRTVVERDVIRLDIIHTALLRLADCDERIEKTKIEEIKSEILRKKFSFEIDYKVWHNKEDEALSSRIIIDPREGWFDFYVVIEKDQQELCRLHIYRGKPTDYYIESLFFYGNWKNVNTFIIRGKSKEMEIRVTIDKCLVEYVNLTAYEKPPFFEMMRLDISDVEKIKAHEDYIHSLPPAMAAIITHEPN